MTSNKNTRLLVANQISHTYASDGGPLPALVNVGLGLRQDEFACLVGPSGCGKSTLLRILAGLLRPTGGNVTLEGEPVTGPDRRVGYVFQQANLMPWRTVLDNVALPLELAGLKRETREAAAGALIDLVGLDGFGAAYPAELSGGMAQRVAIARALISQPSILLLDEPFGSLDAMTRDLLGEELLRIWRGRGSRLSAVLMVTHSISEAILLADRVFVMSPRPGTIEAVYPVALPRPRTLSDLHSREAGELSQAIRSALRIGGAVGE